MELCNELSYFLVNDVDFIDYCLIIKLNTLKDLNNNMLSSNSLFHFTKDVNILSKILINGFRPSYSRENFSYFESNTIIDEYFVPMTCFCDIPLSKINKHCDDYGKFGLGMDINWGIKNGISPVTYIYDKSQVYYSMVTMEMLFLMTTQVEGVQRLDFHGQLASADNLKNLLYNIIPVLSYLKPYQSFDKKKYYDEKEWRYLPEFKNFPDRNPYFLRIPSLESFDNFKGVFLKEIYEVIYKMKIEDVLDFGRNLISESYLKFNIDDLKYLIVENERDIFELKNILQLNSNFTEEEIEKFICRTITYKQINEDF